MVRRAGGKVIGHAVDHREVAGHDAVEVFGAHFEGFRPGRTRLSLAIGLETGGSRDSVFQALVGFGTETLESGAELDTIRGVLGVRNAF